MYLGIDIGSITAKAVLIGDDGKIMAWKVCESGFDHGEAAQAVTDDVLQSSGLVLEQINSVVATGYGRNNISFATKAVTEITCHARGAVHELPQTNLIIDIGGQDSKVIKVDSKGRVLDFCMNDRCAAGTGRFLEVMAASLKIPLEEMGTMAMAAKKPAPISNVCTVFAESEVISLVASGTQRENIIRGLCKAISERVSAMVRQVGQQEPIAMTGGVAYNGGVVMELEARLGAAIHVPPNPQIVGALGAALLARSEVTGLK